MQENKISYIRNLASGFHSSSPTCWHSPNPGPGSGEHLEEEIKWRAVILWKDKKLSPYKIAKQLKIDHCPRLCPTCSKASCLGSYWRSYQVGTLFFQENFNSDKYQEILRACLVKKRLKFSQDCPKKLPQNWVFLQDNSPVHKSKTSMKFVRGLVGDRLIQHPAVSPDLNPNEDMWSYFDRKTKEAKVTTIQGLKNVLTKEWRALPWTEIRKSVDSMGRRLEQCRESGGCRLPY